MRWRKRISDALADRTLAKYTDEIYGLQADLLRGRFAASHEPAALRSQAFIIRLGYTQAIANYVDAWKQLVAAIGLRLRWTPLSRRLAKIIYPIVCLEPLGNPGFLSHRRIGYCGEPPKSCKTSRPRALSPPSD